MFNNFERTSFTLRPVNLHIFSMKNGSLMVPNSFVISDNVHTVRFRMFISLDVIKMGINRNFHSLVLLLILLI